MGYRCGLQYRHKKQIPPLLAALVRRNDKLAGRGNVTPCSNSGEANFEEYREAWHLLRAAAGVEEETDAEASAGEVEEVAIGPAVQRMQNTFDFFRRQLEKGGRRDS